MTETEKQKRRRSVTKLIHAIPLWMDFHDGCVVLTALYDIGHLSKYFKDVARGRVVEFSEYFDFDDDDYVKTDADGRITFLFIPPVMGDNLDFLFYDVPPIVARLQKLKSILIGCSHSIPRELGDLPLLEDIEFCHCSSHLLDNIPDGLRFSSLKRATVWQSEIHSMSRFFDIFPSTLADLSFKYMLSEEQRNEILRVLENDDLEFKRSLTKLASQLLQIESKVWSL